MSGEGTTSINNLPTDNVYDPNANIVMETTPVQNQMQPQQMQSQQMQPQQMQPQQMQPQQMQPQQMQPQQNNPTMYSRPASPQIGQTPNNDPSMMQHINGIQQASMMNNNMDLPSRDIPTNTNHMTQDIQIQPNYLPNGGNTNFIDNRVSQDLINDYNQRNNNILNNNDYVYEQLKIPVIISILFFIFNFNSINNNLYAIFPSLFKSDSTLKTSGFAFKSILFGVSYYSVNNLLIYFSKM